MKQFFFLLILGSAGLAAKAQIPIAPAPIACNAATCITNSNIDVCPPGANTVVGSHRGGSYFQGNNSEHLGEGAIWRFRNMATVAGVTVNVQVTIDEIYHADLDQLDDDNAVDQAGNSIADFFAPRIGPDQNLNGTDRRGYVQFTMRFYRNPSGTNNNSNSDFSTVVNLANLNYVHYDIDGNDASNVTRGTAGSWFRETGVAKRVTAANPIVLANLPTDLVQYAYNDPAATSWTGFAGGVCERDGISRCAQVAASFSYSGAQPSITIRMGYDYNAGGNVGSPVRQYGSRLGCFNFPAQATLPVKLVSFSAIFRGQQTILNWGTENEVNFDKFIVERSANSRDFIPVSETTARGGTSRSNYTATDDLGPVSGAIFYYRLKMLDKDGKYTYSSVVMIRKETKTINGIAISPNPIISGRTSIRFTSLGTTVAELRVIDMTGKTILQQQEKVYEGNNSISVNNLDRLQPGIYTLQIINDSELSTVKFSVVR